MTIKSTIEGSLERFLETFSDNDFGELKVVNITEVKDFIEQSQLALLEAVIVKAEEYRNTYDALGNFIKALSRIKKQFNK